MRAKGSLWKGRREESGTPRPLAVKAGAHWVWKEVISKEVEPRAFLLASASWSGYCRDLCTPGSGGVEVQSCSANPHADGIWSGKVPGGESLPGLSGEGRAGCLICCKITPPRGRGEGQALSKDGLPLPLKKGGHSGLHTGH